MRLGDLILVLGPIVLLAFALGVIDAAFIRVIVIAVVVAGVGYWVATRLAGKQKRDSRSQPERRDKNDTDQK